MSTIVNTPSTSGDNSLAVLLVGVLMTVTAVVLFVIYGVPAIRSMTQAASATPTTIEVQLPTSTEPAAPTSETTLAPDTEPALTTAP